MKMQELRTRLHTAMEEQFRRELHNAISRVQDAIAAYTRFVRAEHEKTAAMSQCITNLNAEVMTLRDAIDGIFVEK